MESSPCMSCVMNTGGSGHLNIELGTVETASGFVGIGNPLERRGIS